MVSVLFKWTQRVSDRVCPKLLLPLLTGMCPLGHSFLDLALSSPEHEAQGAREA